MAATLTGMEKETVIIFNESEPQAEVFAYSSRFKRRLAALAAERPGECRQTRETPEGAIEYRIPKSWLRINPSRSISDEEKAKRTARLEKMRASAAGGITGADI